MNTLKMKKASATTINKLLLANKAFELLHKIVEETVKSQKNYFKKRIKQSKTDMD